jgi:hypothetical protein
MTGTVTPPAAIGKPSLAFHMSGVCGIQFRSHANCR